MGCFNCIDVSEWNGEIDWEQAKADGVEFAFIRCGFGRTGIDKYFDINVEGAKNAGIKIGVYFYSYATDWDSAVLEAEHCIELVDKYKDIIDLPVFYDVEEECNVPRITDICMAFINTLNYDGYNVGIYVTGSWYSAYFKNISCDYIWIAYVGKPDDGEPHEKPEWCDIWQYTWVGTVDGVGVNKVDCDIIYTEDMYLLINGKPEPEPQPEPTPEPEPEPTKAVVELDVLERYDTGSQVNTLKALLKAFDYGGNELVLDEDFDWATEQAVRKFQRMHDLEETGIVDETTWRLLLL